MQLLAAHGRDGVGRVALLDGRGLPGHDHGFQVEHVLLERDLDRALCRGHGHAAMLVPDAAHDERDVTRRGRKRKLPRAVRHRGDRRARH